jgi:hypothetical protein
MTSRAVCEAIRFRIAAAISRNPRSPARPARMSPPSISRNPENYRGRTGAVRRKNTWKIVRVYKRHAEQIEGREITDAEAWSRPIFEELVESGS